MKNLWKKITHAIKIATGAVALTCGAWCFVQMRSIAGNTGGKALLWGGKEALKPLGSHSLWWLWFALGVVILYLWNSHKIIGTICLVALVGGVLGVL